MLEFIQNAGGGEGGNKGRGHHLISKLAVLVVEITELAFLDKPNRICSIPLCTFLFRPFTSTELNWVSLKCKKKTSCRNGYNSYVHSYVNSQVHLRTNQ